MRRGLQLGSTKSLHQRNVSAGRAVPCRSRSTGCPMPCLSTASKRRLDQHHQREWMRKPEWANAETPYCRDLLLERMSSKQGWDRSTLAASKQSCDCSLPCAAIICCDHRVNICGSVYNLLRGKSQTNTRSARYACLHMNLHFQGRFT